MKLAELNDEKKFTKKLKDFNNDPINEYFKSITSEDNYDDEMKKEYIEYMKRNLQYLSLRKREDRRQQLLNSVERFRTIINFKVIEKQIPIELWKETIKEVEKLGGEILKLCVPLTFIILFLIVFIVWLKYSISPFACG